MKAQLLLILICFYYHSPIFGQTKVKVNPVIIDNSFDQASLEKLKRAVMILDSVFNSEEFANRITHTVFNTGNYGLSASQILEIIKKGNDNYQNKPNDYSIDLRVKLFDEYYGYNNFGVTDMNTRITRTHRCYVQRNNVKCYVSHLAHEYIHQIGFYDEKTGFLWSRTKTNSVPYKIGNIVDFLINNNNNEHCVAIKETCK